MTSFTTNVLANRNTSAIRRFAPAFRCFLGYSLLAFLVVGCLLLGTRVSAALPPTGKTATVLVAKCQKDLTQRLKVPVANIKVIDKQMKFWSNAAFGMPVPGKVYARKQMSGWRIILEVKGTQYLYTASNNAIRYGGPLSLWTGSMLYMQPMKNEPNLGNELFQCSLLGTNHVRLISEVTEYYPQTDGVILITRRMSRSSFDLLYLKAGVNSETKKLYSAMAFGDVALNNLQDSWAALVKSGVGADWCIIVARIGQEAVITLPLPTGVRPEQLAWEDDRLAMLALNGEKVACYEIVPTANAHEWKVLTSNLYPGARNFMLNKSETLEITQTGTKAKPSVEVAGVWFTGDRNIMATINGLTLSGYDFVGVGYVLVWGKQGDGKAAAYTVNIATGAVVPTFHGICQAIKPFDYPPVTMP